MRLFRDVLISLFCLSVLTACSGGASGVSSSGVSSSGTQESGAASQETGQVTILIGDSRLFGWDHVWITFAGVQFITADGQEIDALDAPREVDLLSLKHFTERLVPEMDVPTGIIEQVRFIISDIRLERVDDLGATVAEYHPFGFGNVNVSVNNAEVEAGKKLVIEFDFDLNRSIHTSADGSETDFRPVITSKTSNDDGVTPRLMRVEGDVASAADGTATICAIRSAAEHDDELQDSENCVLLVANDATTYFSEANDGSPIVLMSGDHLVAYGLMDMVATQDTVIAEVIAVGDEFVRLDGEALTVVTDGGLDLSVEVYVDEEQISDEGVGHWWPGHDCDWHDGVWNELDWDRVDPGGCYGEDSGASEEPIGLGQAVRHVQLADGSKVFDAEPKEVGAEDIAVTNLLEAEGYPPTMEGDPDVHAFVVLLNHEVLVVAGAPTPTTVVESSEQVLGVIDSHAVDGSYVFVLTNEGVLDCVSIKVDETTTTDIVQIFIDADGMTATRTPTKLVPLPGVVQSIDAVGPPRGEGFCLVADSIVLESGR